MAEEKNKGEEKRGAKKGKGKRGRKKGEKGKM